MYKRIIIEKRLVGAACFLAAHIKAILFFVFFFSPPPPKPLGQSCSHCKQTTPGCEVNPAETTSSGQFRGSMGHLFRVVEPLLCPHTSKQAEAKGYTHHPMVSEHFQLSRVQKNIHLEHWIWMANLVFLAIFWTKIPWTLLLWPRLCTWHGNNERSKLCWSAKN